MLYSAHVSTDLQPGLFDERPSVPERLGTVHVRTVDTLHLLTPGKGRTGEYDYTLNPYRGCGFGCSYCYAPFFVADEALRAAWGKWVDVKVRAVEALARRDLRGKRIYMSSVTDPYQPLERETCLTRSIVEHLAAAQARLVVQTRSPIVARDIDLFRRFERIRVNMSVTTDDDEVRKRFEPACASIERRLEAVRELKAAGIAVSVCLCPMLPMRDPESFGRLLTEIGVDHVAAGWFHHSTRPFAAGTRDEAYETSQAIGWTRERFEEAKAALRRTCPALTRGEVAFGPA